MYQQGYTIYEICQKLFPKKYPIIKLSRGEWDSKNIVTSILTENELA
ncbi:MBL fold metallo-hydrolase, partial [Butyricicoccus sp. 1XD8-22]